MFPSRWSGTTLHVSSLGHRPHLWSVVQCTAPLISTESVFAQTLGWYRWNTLRALVLQAVSFDFTHTRPRSRKPTAPLLKLPSELIAQIVHDIASRQDLMALMLSCRQIYRAVVPLWYRRVCTSRRLTFHRMRLSVLQGLFCNSDALRTVQHLDLDWIICTSGSSAMRQSFCVVSRLNDVLPAMQTLHTLVLPERLVHCGATLRLDSLPSSVRRLAFTRPRDAHNWFVETLLARDVQDHAGTDPDVAQLDTFESRHSILCHASVRRTLRFQTGVTHLAFGCADCECRTMDRLCALGRHGFDILSLRLTGEMLFRSSLYAATRDFTFRCLHTINVIAVSESSTLSSVRTTRCSRKQSAHLPALLTRREPLSA
ncbi:hypothetical protein EXIGLDRAFT_83636 [Exidia glandulosa HHB12029]|uniref:Uncharacterized protein n=1 Tax=Exidia glandulosa HHB12029 TaxID=1314781 RepID=A0A165HJM1_EXIGL|nr:hypothetical protein EXIGLDRAFT_83636 [Exidia glandulosa HHB12029]